MMNNGKKICALLLTLCMLIGILPLSVLAEEADVQSQILGQKLCLGEDLTMHFYAQISEADANATMQVSAAGKTQVYAIADMTAAEDGTYDFAVSLSAAQMTEDIVLTLQNGDAVVLEKTYSVQDYAHYLLNGKYTNETKALVKQMLNYGAAAQVYFDYKTDDLANKGYEQDAPAVTYETQEIAINGKVSGISVYGATMLLQSKIGMRYYFLAPNGVEGLTFTVNDQPYSAQPKGEVQYIDVLDMNPSQMAKEMTVAVTDGTDTMSFSYNPVSYISRMYNKDDSSDALKTLLASLNGYFVAADKYDGLTAGDVSLKENGDHVYPLNETPYVHLDAQTTVSVSQVREGVYPRVGLRLTNAAGATVDFVLGYSNAQEFWADGFYVVTTDAQGVEAKPEWVDLPEGTMPGDDGVVLSVKKEFETTTLYFGEYQALSRKLAGFGADSAITVSLYSRYADAQFTDYSVQEIIKPDSSLNAGNHIYVLNEMPYENMLVHTDLSVSGVMNEVYARVGLRLTNEAGQNLEYVLAYNNNTNFWANGFYVVTYNADGEVTRWIDIEEGILTEDTNVSMQIKVLRGTLQFYMNGALVHSGNFENFAVEGGMTAALYSRYTTTDFSNYTVTQLDPADSDINESDHSHCINETAYDNFAAQTELTVSEVKNGVYARAGLRLIGANGKTLDYVIAYNNNTAFWVDGFYVVTYDDEGVEDADWYDIAEGILPDDDNVTLKVRKTAGVLQFYIDGVLVHTGSYAGFAAENTVTASLYSKHTTTDFENFSAVYVSREDSIVENGTHEVAIDTTAHENFTAQTELTVSQVKNGVYARAGLRLIGANGKTLDYVIAYNNNTAFWPNGFYIVTWDAEGKDTTAWIQADGLLPDDDNVTLKVEKLGGKLYFYMENTLVTSGSYEGFGLTDQATASLYSRHTAADFSNYAVQALHPEDSDLESAYHAYTISSATSDNFTAQTDLTVSGVKDGYYARAGLRLINANGQYLDFVIAYNTNTAFWPDGFYIVTWDDSGKEKTKWVTISDKSVLPDDDEVTMKIQLSDGLLHLYIGETEAFSGTVENFATDVAATVALYSKYATVDFSNYRVK